jgi:hypothetical protein
VVFSRLGFAGGETARTGLGLILRERRGGGNAHQQAAQRDLSTCLGFLEDVSQARADRRQGHAKTPGDHRRVEALGDRASFI